jgi:hypothetical protein
MAAMAFGESIPDKLTKMNEIIKSKIKGNEMSGEKLVQINLQYLDIRLDLYLNYPNQNIISINAFSRGHYVRKNPEHRISHRPSKEQEPASDKGDGALFLALTVIHCNEVFSKILCWIGGVTDWWRIKGVCTIKDACKKTERSGHAYEINNEIFLAWANEIVILFQPQAEHGGGRKRRYKRTNKKRKKRKTRRKTKKRRGKRKKRKSKKRRR